MAKIKDEVQEAQWVFRELKRPGQGKRGVKDDEIHRDL